MRIIRYFNEYSKSQLAAVMDNEEIYSLSFSSILEIVEKAKKHNLTPVSFMKKIIKDKVPLEVTIDQLQLLVPIEAPEVWAAGVTYEKSRNERNYESVGFTNDQTFYDKVYDAKRPEIFLKSTKERTIGPEQDICLRSDSDWQIPEPELGLVLDNHGEIIGYTVGNDMSCRDIEGENPLYLPQAKIWKHSCSIGPAIRLADTVDDPYNLEIICRIYRNDLIIFEDSAITSQLKRKLGELTDCLAKDNVVFNGTVLLTGTCIVPPNNFTLQEGDRIEIEIPGIGLLRNTVKTQVESSIPS